MISCVYVCVCVCMCMRACIHTYIYTYMHTHAYIHSWMESPCRRSMSACDTKNPRNRHRIRSNFQRRFISCAKVPRRPQLVERRLSREDGSPSEERSREDTLSLSRVRRTSPVKIHLRAEVQSSRGSRKDRANFKCARTHVHRACRPEYTHPVTPQELQTHKRPS